MNAKVRFPDAPMRAGDPVARHQEFRSKAFQRILAGRALPVDPEQLQGLARQMYDGDPLADAVIVMYQQLPPGQGRKLLDKALEQGIDAVPEAPQALVDLFRHVDTVPVWLDRDKIRIGAKAFLRTGPFAEMVLRNLALTGGYVSGPAIKTLAFTGQLDRKTPRRLVETARFWLDLMNDDAMSRFGPGFKSAVRVRIMHAQVRNMVLKSSRWQTAEWGMPVSQSDMMATVLEFSIVTILGLRALGFRFTREEREAMYHLCRYMGYLSGVNESILPCNEQDAQRATYLQFLLAGGSDEDSRLLGRAIYDVPMQRAGSSAPARFVARLEQHYRTGFTRLLLGQKNGDALGLPRSPLGQLAVLATTPTVFSMETLRRTVPGSSTVLATMGKKYYERQLTREMERHKTAAAFIPEQHLVR